MTFALYTILFFLLLLAAMSDIRTRLIPNRYPIAITLLFFGAAILVPIPDWLSHLLVATVGFAVCVGLFAAGLLGGGDAKLLPATALWAGPDALAAFLMITAVAGGLIALGMLVRHRFKAPDDAATGSAGAAPTVPYGVAIAAGGVATLSQPLLNALSSEWSVVSVSGV